MIAWDETWSRFSNPDECAPHWKRGQMGSLIVPIFSFTLIVVFASPGSLHLWKDSGRLDQSAEANPTAREGPVGDVAGETFLLGHPMKIFWWATQAHGLAAEEHRGL